MLIQIEDQRTSKIIKIDGKPHHSIQALIDVSVKHLRLDPGERSYALVYKGKELPTTITLEEAIMKFGVKENDKLTLWARVVGG